MPDPAVEAAQRACSLDPLPELDAAGLEYVKKLLTEAAAREMAEPIRDLHKREGGGTPTGEYADMCYECQSYWPCNTARLVYSTEELDR